MPTEKLLQIQREWFAADAAFSAALVRDFGKSQAGTRRYDARQHGWSVDTVAASLEMRRLGDEYREELNRMRAEERQAAA